MAGFSGSLGLLKARVIGASVLTFVLVAGLSGSLGLHMAHIMIGASVLIFAFVVEY